LVVVRGVPRVDVEPLERGLFDGARLVAQGLTLGEALEGLAAQADEFRGGDAEGFLQERVAECCARALGKRCRQPRLAAHAPSPASTWARCSARTRELRRDSPP